MFSSWQNWLNGTTQVTTGCSSGNLDLYIGAVCKMFYSLNNNNPSLANRRLNDYRLMPAGSFSQCNSRYWNITASVTLPLVVERIRTPKNAGLNPVCGKLT
jgi:hypothetical protein